MPGIFNSGFGIPASMEALHCKRKDLHALHKVRGPGPDFPTNLFSDEMQRFAECELVNTIGLFSINPLWRPWQKGAH